MSQITMSSGNYPSLYSHGDINRGPAPVLKGLVRVARLMFTFSLLETTSIRRICTSQVAQRPRAQMPSLKNIGDYELTRTSSDGICNLHPPLNPPLRSRRPFRPRTTRLHRILRIYHRTTGDWHYQDRMLSIEYQ